MSTTRAQHVEAGLSLVFAPGQRPDAKTLRAALAGCQAQAQVVREEDGALEILVAGLVFDCDGLAPAAPIPASHPGTSEGETLRIYPGAHLSGGLKMQPVTRALLAFAAELAVALPCTMVRWHPAGTVIAPDVFSRSVLAWLAGGAFPASGLVALTALADGSVVSRGLAHFVGQEITVRGSEALAQGVVDRMTREGPLSGTAHWTVQGIDLCAESTKQARQVLVWHEEEHLQQAEAPGL